MCLHTDTPGSWWAGQWVRDNSRWVTGRGGGVSTVLQRLPDAGYRHAGQHRLGHVSLPWVLTARQHSSLGGACFCQFQGPPARSQHTRLPLMLLAPVCIPPWFGTVVLEPLASWRPRCHDILA